MRQLACVKATCSNLRFFTCAAGLVLSCAGHVAPDPDREALFTIVTDGALQRDHPCPEARDNEVSLNNGYLPESEASALHTKIAQADLSEVQPCLAQVREYDACFAAVSCAVLAATGSFPAWLLGPELAPCACGVDTEHVQQPFAESPLPETLTACTGLLPVSRVPPRPGTGSACP